MPVYLATIHSYGSWQEDHPKGYVQHGIGLMESNAPLASWRDAHASQVSTRFDRDDQLDLHALACELTVTSSLALHAIATTPTHVHQLIAFDAPLCPCKGANFCGKRCDAYRFVTTHLTHFKRVGGTRLSKRNDLPGRRWFSRGWDVTPVRRRDHYEHLMTKYLPKHEKESGIVKRYR